MVDLHGQYLKIKEEVLSGIEAVIDSSSFINGAEVKHFANELGKYLHVNHVIPCANGTDALQIALMALELEPDDEVIIPSFNYVALAEVVKLLGLKPVYADVHPHYYTIDPHSVREKITAKTKVIAPVHLFGQCAPMEELIQIAKEFNLFVIEDNAQAIGADYTFKDGSTQKAGTIGHIGTTSFFPSKNLGCYGDGGALVTQDAILGAKLQCIANHGQKVKYIHDMVGVNSRLDTIQAAILLAKLPHLDEYNAARNKVATYYDNAFKEFSPTIEIPARASYSTHVFHQYTLVLNGVDRESFKLYLASKKIPSMVYYPIPIHRQNAYKTEDVIPISEHLAQNVVSLPISTEMDEDQLKYIVENIQSFVKQESSASK